jgi:uncharacterized protein YndB with AHSA1/START domain
MTTRIAARPATVWRYFTDPERFARWMGAAQGTATIDPRVGGSLRVEYPAFGQVVAGEVVELREAESFAFTWGYEGEGQAIPVGSSRVEITLRPFDEGTVLELRHSGLPDAASVRQHRGGWRLYVSVLASGAAADQLGPAVEAAVSGWFAAWAETDAARRREQLAACCAESIEFRDAFAALAGLDDLGDHVAASQAFSQGVRLEGTGAVSCCHELVRFDWRAVSGDGQVLATGSNVGRLGLDGRFLSVHGFRDAAAPA